MDYIKDAFDGQELQHIEGNKYLVNTLTDHIPATAPEFIDQILRELSDITDFSACNKVVGDEERGGHITAIVAFEMRKPYSLIKWYPSNVVGETSAHFKSAYMEGELFLNGIEKNDKVLIVEDFIDTGGTIIAMIELIRKIGAEVVDIVAIAEKIDFGAHERIERETGIAPKVLVSVSIAGEKSQVVGRWEHT